MSLKDNKDWDLFSSQGLGVNTEFISQIPSILGKASWLFRKIGVREPRTILMLIP